MLLVSIATTCLLCGKDEYLHRPLHQGELFDNNNVLGPHLHVGRRPDVVDLEDHLDQLGGELDLGLLAVQGLDHALLLHVAGAHLHAVHTKCRVALRHLPEKD